MLRMHFNLLSTSKNSRLYVNFSRREFSGSIFLRSSNKRRTLLQQGRKKENSPKSILNESHSVESLSPQIVQLRPITSNNYPFLEPKKSSHSSANIPTPPPTCPRPGSSNYNPPPPPPPKPDNTLRNIILGLLGGGAIIGGLYYFYDDKDTIKPQLISNVKQFKQTSVRQIVRNPASKSDFPSKVPYILIGGGTASFAAFRAIKSREPNAQVLVISAEDALPYMRPPLSKEIWYQKSLAPADKLMFRQWNGQERSIYYEPSEFYTNITELTCAPHGGVSVATGWAVTKVDPMAHTVEIEDPESNSKFEICYDKCLIATGSRPKNLPIFEQASPLVQKKVVLYRNIRDLEDLWMKLENVKNVAIVGGGFLGSELACALSHRFKANGLKIHQVFKESGSMGHVLPQYLAEWTTAKVRAEGVNVITGVEVKEAVMYNNDVVLTLSNESSIKCDVVIVAVGSEPNTQLADTSTLELHESQGGFLVNAELEARTDMFVAGDAACFYDPVLGRRRVEHHDHAVVSGRLAGENMTGAAKGYKHQSMFWSDLGHDIGYEAIGIVDACLPTVGVFAKGEPEKKSDRLAVDGAQESGDKKDESTKIKTEGDTSCDVITAESKSESLPKKEITLQCKDIVNKASNGKDYNKGVIFYLKNDMVVGILLWNVFNKMHIARQVIAEKRKFSDLNEVAKLFKIHDEEDL